MDQAPERFAGLYDRYYRNILRYALTHSEPGSAEDVASEVFLIAWRQLPDIPEPPLPWLLGVARNLLRQQAGAGRRRRRLADRIAALATDADTTAWDAADHVVERASALEVLLSLPEHDIEALTLVTWHGLGPADAAAAAGCSPRAFTVRLHRAPPAAGRGAAIRGPATGARTARSPAGRRAAARLPSRIECL